MDYKMVIPVLVSFALSVIMGPVVIPILRKLKMGQTEPRRRCAVTLKESGDADNGRRDHSCEYRFDVSDLYKRLPESDSDFVCDTWIWDDRILDDYLKVVMRRSDGLYPKQKMALQILVTGIFAYYIVRFTDVPLTWLIPFSEGKYLDWGIFALPLLFVVVIGTVNGVNFTDGLDGLASSVTVLVATFFYSCGNWNKKRIEPITCAVVGALLGFLLFNVYPASVFMGDTGSLALGGFVASTAYMLQMPFFIAIVG